MTTSYEADTSLQEMYLPSHAYNQSILLIIGLLAF